MIDYEKKTPTIKEKLAAMEPVDVTKPSERTVNISEKMPRNLPSSALQLIAAFGYSESEKRGDSAFIKRLFHRIVPADSFVFDIYMENGVPLIRETDILLDKNEQYQVPVTYEQEHATRNLCPIVFYGKLFNMSRSFKARFFGKDSEEKEEDLDKQLEKILDEMMARPDIPPEAYVYCLFRKTWIKNMKDVMFSGLKIPGDWEIGVNDKGEPQVQILSTKKKILVKDFFSPLFRCEVDGEFIPLYNNKRLADFWISFQEDKMKENHKEALCQISGHVKVPIDFFPYHPGYAAKISGTSEDYDVFFNPKYYGGKFLPYTASKSNKAEAFQKHCFTCSYEAASMISAAVDLLRRENRVMRLTSGNTEKILFVFPAKVLDKRCSTEEVGRQIDAIMDLNPDVLETNVQQDLLQKLLAFSDSSHEENQEMNPDQDAISEFRRQLCGYLEKRIMGNEVYFYLLQEAFNQRQITYSAFGWFTFEEYKKSLLNWQQYGNVPQYVFKHNEDGGKDDFRLIVCAPAYKHLILIDKKAENYKPNRDVEVFASKAKSYLEETIAPMLFDSSMPFCLDSYAIWLVVEALNKVSYKENKNLYFRQLMASASIIMKKYKMEELIVNLNVLVQKSRKAKGMSQEEVNAFRDEIEAGITQETLNFLNRTDVSDGEKVSYVYGRMFSAAKRVQSYYEYVNKGNRADIASKRQSLINDPKSGWVMIDRSLNLICQKLQSRTKNPNNEDRSIVGAAIDTIHMLYATIGDSYNHVFNLDPAAFLVGEAAQESCYILERQTWKESKQDSQDSQENPS